MKKIFGLLMIAIAILLTNCDDPNKDKDFSVFEGVSIGAWFEANEDFSLWTALLKRTNLFNALTVQNSFTCFAAKNSAVETYLKANGYNSIEDMEPDKAAYLMRYHVIVGLQIESNSMSNGRLADTTASGDYLVTEVLAGNIIKVNDTARIVTKDQVMINGIIHVLENVLDPIMDPLQVFIEDNPDYSIFAEAARQTGYDKKLSEIWLSTGAKSFTTVFVIPDEVFKSNGIHNFNDLVARYAFGNTNYKDSTNQLNKYVGYHCLQGMYSFNDLANFTSEIKKKNIPTYAMNELIMVEDIQGNLIFNKDEVDEHGIPTGGYRLLEKINMQAKNGVMHEIDGLMPVYSPIPTTVKIELTDASYFPEFATLEWYHRGREAGQGKTNQLNVDDPNQFPYIRWQTTPEGAGRVWYQTRGTWGGSPTQFFDNMDVLSANMGAVGWWEIDLPAIVKGRYKVTFRYHYAVNRGTYQASFDGKNVGAPVVFGNTGSTYTWKIADLGIVSFLETSTHTLRFTVVSPGDMEIDYIVFEPVK